MKFSLKKLLPLLLFFLYFNLNSHVISYANEETFLNIHHLDDIPQNDVNSIFQDSRGFIWFGTLDGLHRYDGYSYKTYRINEGSNSISSNMVLLIDEDDQGNIWIGTYGKGICKLNPVTEQFTSYTNEKNNISNDVTSLLIDDKNYIWFGNWFGVYRVEMDKTMDSILNVSIIPIDKDWDNNESAKVIHQDNEGQIWVGTNGHLIRIKNPYVSPELITFEKFEFHTHSITSYKNGIIAGGWLSATVLPNQNNLTYDLEYFENATAHNLLYSNNRLIFGNRQGINFLIAEEDGTWKQTIHLSKNFTDQSIGGNIVSTITEDNIGQIWIGSRGGGVNLINANAKRFKHYKHERNEGSLSNNLTRCMFIDSNENLWIGTEEGGVNFLPKNKKDKAQNSFKTLAINKNVNENRVYAIEEQHFPTEKKNKSILWMGTSYPSSLVSVNPITFQKKYYSEEIRSKLGFIFTILAEDDSTLWAGTYGKGLFRLKTDAIGNISSIENFTPNKEKGYALTSFIVRHIKMDREGNIWVATDKGLNFISKSEKKKRNPKIIHYLKGSNEHELAHDYLLQIFEAQNGKLWIGSMGGGLIECTNQQDGIHFKSITTKDGLPNNSVKSILEDENGFLWLSTNNGLCRYNPFNKEIIIYDKEDGLQANEFSEICAVKRPDGQMIFGGLNGISVFFPHEISIDKNKPKLFFTDFQILNKEVETGTEINGRIILDKAIEFTESINLKYKENSFSIGFVGLQYNSPQKNSYKYKLEGFDEQWFNASPNYRMAKYTNIPPGQYEFMVIGANCDNVWTDTPISLKIKVDPPLYYSKWALILYFILVGFIVLFVTRISLDISTRKRELLISNLEKNKIEEISKIKLQFFTNISHEFRTPLTLINAPLDKLIKNNEVFNTDERVKNYQLIKQNVNVMLRLINQLLDFRRLDQNKMKLRLDQLDLNHFITPIYESFSPLAEQKRIQFKFAPSPYPILLNIDTDKIEKVMYNLLSNAFKFTPTNGEIEITLVEDKMNENAIISVKDSGIGIENDEQSYIFERYYQTQKKDKLNYGGTGIGLSLSKGLVELHHGSLDFYSKKGEGTTFFVHLPTGDIDYDEAIIENPTLTDNSNYYNEIEEIDNENQQSLNTSTPVKTGQKILLVEDNIDLRNVVAEVFSDNFKVFQASDGVEGLAMCLKHHPDIVISDIMMPNMNGIELCKQIKENESISHIPVILLTAKDTEESQIEGYETGADNYIPKPFSTDVLKANVIATMNNRDKLRMKFQKEIQINPEIISNSPADSKFLDNILAIIEENLSESDFTVEKLAETYGVSRIYLNRKLKALTGETSNQFLRNIRLKHAAELLQQNVLTVSEVTWKVGYNDLRTFRSRFKEMFGVSPSEFAKQAKAEKEKKKEETDN